MKIDNKINPRKKLEFKRFIITFSMGIFDIIMHYYCLTHQIKPGDIKYMTVWNYNLCSVYIILITICDMLFFFNKKNLEFFNYILREIISPVVSTNTYLVSITFWFVIKLMEEIKDKNKPEHSFTNIKNLYVHLVISILISIDTIFTEKNEYIFNKMHYLYEILFITVYGLFIFIRFLFSDKTDEDYVYDFFKKISLLNSPLYIIGACTLVFLCYYLYIFLMKFKAKKNLYIRKYIKNDSYKANII